MARYLDFTNTQIFQILQKITILFFISLIEN